MKAFQAYGRAGRKTAETPRRAALTYFATFPRARKCSVVEGTIAGAFFTVSYGIASEGTRPTTYADVTPKSVDSLPEAPQE